MNKYICWFLILFLVILVFYDYLVENMADTITNDNDDQFYINFYGFLINFYKEKLTFKTQDYKDYAAYLVENKNKNINLANLEVFNYIARSLSHEQLSLDCLKNIAKNGIKNNPCALPN